LGREVGREVEINKKINSGRERGMRSRNREYSV
jgi:hypothetical protein